MRDVVVVGGGPAGASAALLLARQGRDVELIEREPGPANKVCGEFLSKEAALYLRSLGIDLPRLGALPIDHVRVVRGSRVVASRLPFVAWSLSRRVMDEALLDAAAAAGATVTRGAAVRELTRLSTGSRGWSLRLEGGATTSCNAAFLATGKYDLRGHKRPAGVQNDLVAFKMHFHLAPAQAAELARHVELTLFDGGYAGLQPVDEGRANLCLLVRRDRLAAVGRWPELLAFIRAQSPHFDARLTGGEPCTARPLSLSAIPYGHVRRHADDDLWRLGDQAAVIPSFSGDGMSIALHSARVACAAFAAGSTVDAYQRSLAKDVRAQVAFATALSLGLVRRPAQRALVTLARLVPGIVRSIAGHTRVPDAALERAGAT